MSHFSCIVPAQNKQELEKMLLPYHEYETTGILDYTEFIPLDMEEAQKEYQKYGEDQHFDEFVRDWYGVHKNKEGVWGKITNPNKHWDWTIVGGRYSNLLILRSGEKADDANAGDIDFDAMRKDLAHSYSEEWDNVKQLLHVAGITMETFCAAEMDGNTDALRPSIETIRLALFGTPEHPKHASDAYHPSDAYAIYHSLFDFCSHGATKEAHLKALSDKALTFAFIDCDGSWHQRADMGWFGCTSDERETEYRKEFWDFINSLSAKQHIFVVDCHI